MLEARSVTIKYGARIAVSDVSLVVQPGELTAVIGPNGAGKSSLLRTLNGAIKPTTGEVILEGQGLERYSRRSVARRIAVVAQEAETRFPVTVLEFVLGGRFASSGGSTWGWETEADVALVKSILAETDLKGMEGRLLNELSGGERQRVVLARALATEASYLLLDEPTANLDLAHQAAILSLVRQRCDSGKTAAVVVTHDVNLAAEFSDRVLLLKDGRTVALGTSAEVLTAQQLESAFDQRVLVDAHPISGAPRITPVHETRRSF